ncbi:MAG TPA: hypothetical protein ENJ27_00585 [Candidatus Moranbacteria bacterium]|nr:hypothetical protein [Candidatus Moranbacteria bacterium]
MKIKMKKVLYSILSAGVVAPVSIFAYDPPANTTLPGGSVTNIVSNIMTWILGLVGFLGVIGFAISGILYLTAAGDEDRITTAKRAMTWSIVGVIVALLGVVIIKAANSMLGGTSSDF